MDHTKDLWHTLQGHLTRANADRKHPWTKAVLTTYDGTYPQSRWVVNRGRNSKGIIVLYTDSRSPKVSQIEDYPHGQILLYHDRQKIQVRIDVLLQIHREGELYNYHLTKAKNRPSDYLTSKAPGSAGTYDIGSEMYFAVIEAQPKYYDVLQLGTPHLRVGYSKINGVWQGTSLVP